MYEGNAVFGYLGSAVGNGICHVHGHSAIRQLYWREAVMIVAGRWWARDWRYLGYVTHY
jgi:hypothetical protein